jgi:hypothetical protein
MITMVRHKESIPLTTVTSLEFAETNKSDRKTHKFGTRDQNEMPAVKDASISRDRERSLQELMCSDLSHM